nr:FtsX-like permease family protein [Bacteroidota bacterium]
VNFTNLSVAYSTNRLKEASLRKLNGATRGILINQFLAESVMMSLLGLFVGFVLFETFLPWFNQMVNRDLDFEYFNELPLFLVAIGIALLLGLASGIYPAILISSTRPFLAAHKGVRRGTKNPVLRKVLVGIQFFISVFFIVGTVGVLRQVNYMKHKDLGYVSENVVRIPFSDTTMNRINFFRNQILTNPNIVAASVHDYPVQNSTNWTRVSWEGAEEGEFIRMNDNYSDHHFIETYEMKLTAGEGFLAAQKGNDAEGNRVVINEAAVEKMRIKDPVGKHILYGGDYRGGVTGNKAMIAGVIKDFHFISAHNVITPMMIRLYNEEETGWCISVRISGQNMKGTINFLDKQFADVFPGQLFEYSFVDEGIETLYNEEVKLAGIIFYLAILAIFIACLGIFGLVSFTTASRTKEIGIRKVMGSGIIALIVLFAREFIVLIAIANLLAWPVAYLVVQQWLQNFPYQVDVSVWPYLAALVATVLFALLSMTWKIIAAARANPVMSLRYE